MPNIGENLSNERIADYYTSLLHVSGADLVDHAYGITDLLSPNDVYDGVGNTTGLALSALHDRVIINNYIYPEGYDDLPYPDGSVAPSRQGATEWLDAFFPIGVIMLTTNNNDPTLRIAGTKWCKIDTPGQFLVGIGSSADKNDDLYRFAQHDQQPLGGDLAGEYRHRLTPDELPRHTHLTDAEAVVLGPQNGQPNVSGNNEDGTASSFFYYFGPAVNPKGLINKNSRTGASFAGENRIAAFQNNTPFTVDGIVIPKYRDWLIRERHYGPGGPYRYTDADFQPTLANRSLAGWAATGTRHPGPGWAGFLDETPYTGGWRDGDLEEIMTRERFITDSPRPVGGTDDIWTNKDGQQRRILQSSSGWDQRVKKRVHPGTLNRQQLIIARNYLINLLGFEDAAVALSEVNRLVELDATVEVAIPPQVPMVSAEIPMRNIVETSNAGAGDWHNNIPPNYGIFAWRRVEPSHICGLYRIEIGPLWKGTITRDYISERDEPFNLNKWALGLTGYKNEDNLVWNGKQEAHITIADGVYIYAEDNGRTHSDSTAKVPAMIIEDFPSDLTLINNGIIMGRGGNGGYGTGNTRKGQNAGDAIQITGFLGKIFINNTNGKIGGGGGGGSTPGGTYFNGGGGGAGGGLGGRCARSSTGGTGGSKGQPGGHGTAGNSCTSYDSFRHVGYGQNFRLDIMNDGFGPRMGWAPGIGGEAGGSGGVVPYGGSHKSGWLASSAGGGGGRVLKINAIGGGTGGVPGTSNSGLNANGSVKSSGPGAILQCHYNSSAPQRGWLSGLPLNDTGCPGKPFNRPGKNPDADWFPKLRANTSSNCKLSRTRKNPPQFSCRAWFTNYGYHWRASQLPHITTTIITKAPHPVVTPAKMSPTGWNGFYHYSTNVHGGYENQPGVYKHGVGSRGSPGYFAAGGGGWGAAGGSVPNIPGGEGGNAITRSGDMSYTFVDEEGEATLNEGLVWGTKEH